MSLTEPCRIYIIAGPNGAGIPEDVIRRRYQRGLFNFFEIYAPLVSSAYVYDASQLPPVLAWESAAGTENEVDSELWTTIKQSKERAT